MADIAQDVERAAERAYCAYLESAHDFLPSVVHTWSQLHPVVRKAWIDAIAAVYAMPRGAHEA
jgi:hypothetical protein